MFWKRLLWNKELLIKENQIAREMLRAVCKWRCVIRCSKYFHFWFFILRFNLVLLNIFISEKNICKTEKLGPLLPRSTATRSSLFQTERVHGSGSDDHTRHFQTLVPTLKYVVSIFSIIPINPFAALRYILYINPYCTNVENRVTS